MFSLGTVKRNKCRQSNIWLQLMVLIGFMVLLVTIYALYGYSIVSTLKETETNPTFMHQSDQTRSRRKIFIDLGTYLGDTLHSFDQRVDANEFTAFGWECDPKNIEQSIKTIRGKHETYRFNNNPANIPRFDVHFIPYCAWIEDTELNFESGLADKSASHIVNEKAESSHFKETVPAKDFIAWLKRNIDLNDYIVLKIDIECAEFAIIPKLISTRIIDSIDELHIEWHDWIWSCDGNKKQRMNLDKMINQSGLHFQYAIDGVPNSPKTQTFYSYDRETWSVHWLNSFYFRKQKDTKFKSPWDGVARF